ncbi:MAG: flagellar biosynthetic protein FliO [Gammaproteobacteria bacterium]|nr:flagellar biosynthetic protein FliO [Gammaproteobacteria bacterium]
MHRFQKLTLLFVLLFSQTVTAATEEKIMPVDPLSAASIANMFMGLGLVLVVIFFMAWLVRRMGGMQLSGSQRIRLLGGLSLGPREKVVLIQIENKRLLLGVAQGQVNTLHELEGEYENIANQTSDSATDFKDKLLQALNKTLKK